MVALVCLADMVSVRTHELCDTDSFSCMVSARAREILHESIEEEGWFTDGRLTARPTPCEVREDVPQWAPLPWSRVGPRPTQKLFGKEAWSGLE